MNTAQKTKRVKMWLLVSGEEVEMQIYATRKSAEAKIRTLERTWDMPFKAVPCTITYPSK